MRSRRNAVSLKALIDYCSLWVAPTAKQYFFPTYTFGRVELEAYTVLYQHAFGTFQTKINTPCSSSRAMWTRALFLVLLISVCSLSWHALRLASVLADRPSSRSFSQYQAQPCSNHTTTPSRARHSPMHSSAFPWQLWRPSRHVVMKRQFRQREKLDYNFVCADSGTDNCVA